LHFAATVAGDVEGAAVEVLHDPLAARIVLREERNFVEVVDGTFEIPAKLTGGA
jgi:hypothetical protein